ncbi:MAG: AI-2E family transporter [Actinobacteria bacterium]|nr:AI-2E family transporter [Actinomycetota bacterium]MCL6094211.1 AI-2E family transporter [Actinomycetota bacterium]
MNISREQHEETRAGVQDGEAKPLPTSGARKLNMNDRQKSSWLRRFLGSTPIRTILVADAVIISTVLIAFLLWELRGLILLIVVAAFIAVILDPAVALLERARLSRGIAALLIFLLGALLLLGIVFLIAQPIYQAATHFVQQLPKLVNEAEHGRGRIGRFVVKYHIAHFVDTNAPKLESELHNLGKPALVVGKAVVSGAVSFTTIVVMTLFMLLEAPSLRKGMLSLFDQHYAARVSEVARKAAKSVSGFMLGNVITSIIAGGVVFLALFALGVPFAEVLAVWVGLVDLLPLIGGLLAGVPTVFVAFLHSTSAGIVTAAVFIAYQTVENHLLSPLVMSKTVRLNPLWVFLSVLVGGDLGNLIGSAFGAVLGAILAIPIAGAIQVIAKELRQGPP